ncbi:nucleotide exchange factor GrpE [Halegenticoccus soli]|uniref:nucleotide exchange factor GrpE n=1 Tax=Halegenticoccus soli TaxID=1985678 RepID=UPI000C6EE410|nr:nucleotide exchange factor GrpE [Halegenticoccus soli]
MTDDAGEARGTESEQLDDAPEEDAVGASDGEAASTDEDAAGGSGGAAAEHSGDEEAGGSEAVEREPAEEALASRVAEHDDELASAVRELQTCADELESELAERDERISDLRNRLKRSQADFQNYKKRAKKRQEQLRERATEDLVERLVTVRDNLVRALEQDENADIRDGVRATLDEFDRVLADENVTPIEPEPGEDVDPQRHEVMMRVESDQPEDTIADVYQPGYEIADRVLRAAQVTVSKSDDE